MFDTVTNLWGWLQLQSETQKLSNVGSVFETSIKATLCDTHIESVPEDRNIRTLKKRRKQASEHPNEQCRVFLKRLIST